MTGKNEVVLYGASGYTGKLTAWKLAERGIPFTAAGRNQTRLAEEMAKVPELKGHDYECVGIAHEKAALVKLFTGKKVVLNIVGPFMQLGLPVVEAALEAGCHYFDTTGETDWMALLQREYGRAFAAKGLALCPGNSYMWTEGNLATEIALETPGIDTLDVVYLADSDTSVASTMSFLQNVHEPAIFSEKPGARAMAVGHGLSGSGARRACALERAALERRRRADLVRAGSAGAQLPGAGVVPRPGAVQRDFRRAAEIRGGVPAP